MIQHSFELQINPKFRDLLDMPSEAERKELERQLIRDGGPRDPLIVWEETNTLVDGHNRHAICIAHNLPFKTEKRSFKDEAAVEEWILENQLARRNLTPARATYFLGLLYNKHKQDPAKVRTATEDGKSTAAKLGEQFGVSERTVRRAGDMVKGAETVAKVAGLDSVKAKLAVIQNRNEATGFNKGELQEIGKLAEKDEELAKKTVEVLVEEKKEAAKAKPAKPAKPAAQKSAPKPADKKDLYTVVFSKPDFDRIGWSVANEERPPMADNCMVYMQVPDESLMNGMDLFKKWGLTYEASFIFKTDRIEGTWSDIIHTFLLVGSRGTMAGPKKASPSYIVPNGAGLDGAMIKLIESYHQKDKRLDMRKKVTAEGWESLNKAQ